MTTDTIAKTGATGDWRNQEKRVALSPISAISALPMKRQAVSLPLNISVTLTVVVTQSSTRYTTKFKPVDLVIRKLAPIAEQHDEVLYLCANDDIKAGAPATRNCQIACQAADGLVTVRVK